MQDCNSRCQLCSRLAEIIILGAWCPVLNRCPFHTATTTAGINGQLGQQDKQGLDLLWKLNQRQFPPKATSRWGGGSLPCCCLCCMSWIKSSSFVTRNICDLFHQLKPNLPMARCSLGTVLLSAEQCMSILLA